MKCKDIPERPVLEYLSGRGCCGWYLPGRDVAEAMPPYTPTKMVLAKMGKLIKRGLVNGCACGCRGDFKITDKGRDALL